MIEMGRFFSGISLGLGATAMSACITNDKGVWVLVGIGTLVFYYGLMLFEDRMLASDGAFINRLLYYLTKNERPYIMKYVEVEYKYISKQEMMYSKRMALKAVGEGITKYIDKYCWSSHGDDVKVEALDDSHTVKILRRRQVWDMLEIDFHDRFSRGQVVNTGMKMTNMIDKLGIAQPFLTLMTSCKIKERKMKVIIPKELKSCHAKFIVYPENNHEKIIKKENLEYNDEIGGYSKVVPYPRQGWVYSIVWEWEE